MSNIDIKAAIESIGGKVEAEPSSLNENKVETPVETPETPVEKPVENTDAKVETPVKTSEVKTETPKIETPATPEAKAPEVKAEEVAAEKKAYKGLDIYKNLNEEFKEENGISLREAEEILAIDYDSPDMNERELVEDFWRASQWSDIEINANKKRFDILFKTDAEIDQAIEEGKITEDQFDLLNAEWSRIHREGKNFLQNNVQKYWRDKVDQFEVEPNIDTDTSEFAKQFVEKATSYGNQYAKETLVIKDNQGNMVDSFDFVANDQTKGKVMNVLSAKDNVYSRWMVNGQLDISKMFADLHYLENRDAIHKAIYDQAMSKSKTDIVKDQSNISFEAVKQPGAQTNNGISQSMRDVMNKIAGY